MHDESDLCQGTVVEELPPVKDVRRFHHAVVDPFVVQFLENIDQVVSLCATSLG